MELLGTMSQHSTLKNEDAIQTENGAEKCRGRFNPAEYFEEYAPNWSNSLQQRTRLLWTLIEGDKLGKNEPSWAQCCHVLERKKLKGHLGHPSNALIPISRLFSQEQIQNEAQLADFLKRTLPVNNNREPRLPQVNMRHPNIKEGNVQSSERCQEDHAKLKRRAEQTESRLIFLEAMVQEQANENRELREEIQVR